MQHISSLANRLSWDSFKINVVWGHRITHIFAGALLVGVLALLVKKIVDFCRQSWQEKYKEKACCLHEQTIDSPAALKQMQSYAAQARKQFDEIAVVDEAELTSKTENLKFSLELRQTISPSADNCNTTLIQESDSQYIVGNFAGNPSNNGAEAAKKASVVFSMLPPSIKDEGTAFNLLHAVFHETQRNIRALTTENSQTSAFVSVVSKTGCMYTATHGNGFGFIIRNHKFIPMNMDHQEKYAFGSNPHHPHVSIHWLKPNDLILWTTSGHLNRVPLKRILDFIASSSHLSTREINEKVLQQLNSSQIESKETASFIIGKVTAYTTAGA